MHVHVNMSNNFLFRSDSKCSVEGMNMAAEDVRDRVHNWDLLMKNIKAYYKVPRHCCLV